MALNAVVNAPRTSLTSNEILFPNVDAGLEPFGSRVLVQIKMPKSVTAGGIIVPEQTRDTERDNTQVAIVRAMGPLAYHNRQTLEPWPESRWCHLGQFVRVPKYAGERFYVDHEGERIVFALFDDHQLLGRITADPTEVRAYL